MNSLFLLAQRGANSSANKWLSEHPLVLGLLALLIGAAVGGSGIYEMGKGVSRDKYGNEIKGGLGKLTAVFRVVIGATLCVFGVYKMLAG